MTELDLAQSEWLAHPRPSQRGWKWTSAYELRHRRLLLALGVYPEVVEEYVARRWPTSFEGFAVVDGRISDAGCFDLE